MKFYDNYNKGNGCKTFFEAMEANGMADLFLKNYDTDKYIDGEYLTTTHIVFSAWRTSPKGAIELLGSQNNESLQNR